LTPNCEKVEKRNLSPSLNLARNFLVSNSAFVRLHRPPPVRRSFSPRDSFFSISMTFAPSSAARRSSAYDCYIPDCLIARIHCFYPKFNYKTCLWQIRSAEVEPLALFRILIEKHAPASRGRAF